MSNVIQKNKFYAVLRDVAERNNFVNYEIIINDDRDVAEGYVGKINEAQIISENETLNVIIKSCRFSEKIRAVIPLEIIFKRETYMYDTVFPLFRSFELEKGLKPLQFAPKYYNSCSNKEFEALVLNNLNKTGFSIYRKDFLDDNHLKLVLKQYAQFHAISLAYQDQHPLKFETLVEPMDNIVIKIFKDGGFLDVFADNMKKALASLDSKLDEGAENAFTNLISGIEKYTSSIPSLADKYTAIVHGDCWKNNMMFKYDNEETRSLPTEVRMFDYQISRPSSPMLDIANFFYTSGSKAAVDNVQYYLEMYYDVLSKHVQALGSNPDVVYPRSIMMDHWKKCAPYGLITRLMIFNIVFSDEKEHKGISDSLDLDTELSNMFNYKSLDLVKYADHCKHIIIHFYENKLI